MLYEVLIISNKLHMGKSYSGPDTELKKIE